MSLCKVLFSHFRGQKATSFSTKPLSENGQAGLSAYKSRLLAGMGKEKAVFPGHCSVPFLTAPRPDRTSIALLCVRISSYDKGPVSVAPPLFCFLKSAASLASSVWLE